MPQDKNMEFSVVGYGRFGKLWTDILSEHASVSVYENNPEIIGREKGKIDFVDLNTALSRQVVFLCVPISAMEEFLIKHAKDFGPDTTVIDTASVKTLPLAWMDRSIPSIRHLGVHPLFGPDSYVANQNNLLILTPSEQYPELARIWSEIFASWRFFTKTISAEEHDRSIAYSQGVTHFVGNVLHRMALPRTNTPTLGYTMLQDVERFCRNDTPQLFRDMLTYNPESLNMYREFMKATHEVSGYFRKDVTQIDGETMILGVMGAEGSFSQEAGEMWVKSKQLRDARITCLTTAEKVYEALNFGMIHVGLLPIQNAVGGMVLETVQGLAKHSCKITGFFPFLVNQCLMRRKDMKEERPVSIHSHPQALRQCKTFLKTHYPDVPLIEEEDTAVSAYKLSVGELPENAWVIASETCIKLYQLKIVQKKIQDLAYNVTDFVTVINK
ncbi:MAG: prephenate dehydrogenase/arogenate dehydrogenase family protein [FCB group bacterium]|nr:prephenate dehydrogenase/arogenate dehydrogenase family protein [FCB group bacterium]